MSITLNQAKKQYASHYNQAMFENNESLAKVLDPMTMLEFDQWFLQLSLNDGEITHSIRNQLHNITDVDLFYSYASDVFGEKLNHGCLCDKLDQLAEFKATHIIIDNQSYTILKTINVLSASDCGIDEDYENNKAYLVENNGVKSLITYQNGNHVITDVKFLNQIITQYQQLIVDAQSVIDQLNDQKGQ